MVSGWDGGGWCGSGLWDWEYVHYLGIDLGWPSIIELQFIWGMAHRKWAVVVGQGFASEWLTGVVSDSCGGYRSIEAKCQLRWEDYYHHVVSLSPLFMICINVGSFYYYLHDTANHCWGCYQSIRYFVVVYLVQELCDWKLKIPFGLDWAKLHLTLWSYLISLALRSHCVCKSGAYWMGFRSPCLLSKRVFALYELSSRPCVAHVEDNNGGWSPVTSTEGGCWRTRRNLPFKWGEGRMRMDLENKIHGHDRWLAIAMQHQHQQNRQNNWKVKFGKGF